MHKANYNEADQVYVGNGKGLTIKHIGSSTVKSPISDDHIFHLIIFFMYLTLQETL